MSDSSRSRAIIGQIVVAVVIALLVGGTAPWWWKILVRESGPTPQPNQGLADPLANMPQQPQSVPEAVVPSSDFAGGSRRVYSADFSTWPTINSEHGSVSLDFGNSYALQPSSNTWIGPDRPIEVVPALEGDFVVEVQFRIEKRNPSASLAFDLTGGEADAERVQVYFNVWDKGNVTYSLSKERVRSGGGLPVPHAIPEGKIAEREQLPPALKEHDWSQGSKLTLKREGGRMQFFVNDGFVHEFGVSRFTVKRTGLGAAFESKVVVTSIEARARE